MDKDLTAEDYIQTVEDNFLLYAPERFKQTWLEVAKLARIGAAVEAMPVQSSLTKQSSLCDDFAGFQWKFTRVGEETETVGADPLTVLTFHTIPVGAPIPESES